MSGAFTVEHDDGVVIVTFDLPGEPVNKLSQAIIAEFDAVFSAIERDITLDKTGAVVIMSGKPDSFIVGADIDEFLSYKTAAQAQEASAQGKSRLDVLEKSHVHVVAAIHGACMGGGLELALACQYRIVTDHPKTVLALPETQLGLIPGLGGTQRLPRFVGLPNALDMILGAKQIRARKAVQMGLAEEVVHPSILKTIAIRRARELAMGSMNRHTPRLGIGARLLGNNPLGRAIVLSRARATIARKGRGNYPALPAAIEAVVAGYAPRGQGFATESRLFGEMAMTPVSRQLIDIFFATNALKKDTGVEGGGPAPMAIPRMAVLGAGFMGAGIAAVSAQSGIAVRLKDVSREQVGHGLAAARDALRERFTKRHVTRQQYEDELSLVAGTTSYEGFHGVPLVIEAVFEDLEVKQKVLREVEPLLRDNAIYATNTSTIPIAEIARAAVRPERVLGMHFFSPAHRMPLLEIVVTPQTAPGVITTAVAFGRSIGKTPVVVHDSPGFFANRILAPYLNEAGRLFDEGVAIEDIDRAMLDWGFPVGPIMLLDEVGLDIAAKSGAIFLKAFGARLEPSPMMERVLGSGRLGRKNRHGFYAYDSKGKREGVDPSVYDLLERRGATAKVSQSEIQERLALAMVNEAMRVLDERVVRQPRDGDVAAIFGIGFPPFRGGPYRFVDATGAESLVRRLEAIDRAHAGRFEPAGGLVRLAGSGGKVYT